MATDPITGIAEAVSDVALLITKALPGDEQQLLKFKMRSPAIYQRIHTHMLNKDYRQLSRKKNLHVPIKSFVEWEHSDLPVSEQTKLIEILQAELNRI